MILCQEIVHSLRSTKARRGGMVIKIDMEKAYDRISWDFLEETLRDAAIPEHLISVIMHITSTSKCRLLWNGEATDYIQPTRGLQQEILSPRYCLSCAWSA